MPDQVLSGDWITFVREGGIPVKVVRTGGIYVRVISYGGKPVSYDRYNGTPITVESEALLPDYIKEDIGY